MYDPLPNPKQYLKYFLGMIALLFLFLIFSEYTAPYDSPVQNIRESKQRSELSYEAFDSSARWYILVINLGEKLHLIHIVMRVAKKRWI